MPPDAAIAEVAQRILDAAPGTSYASIAQELSQCGPQVTRKDVSRALSQVRALKERKQQAAPVRASELSDSWLERNRNSRAMLVRLAVRELLTSHPGLTAQQVMEKLRPQFPGLTHVDVSREKAGWRPKKPRAVSTRRTGGQVRHAKSRPMLQTPAQVCPSCEVPISLTGNCRCS